MELKDELTRQFANIEELTTQQLITVVKRIMVAVATGHDIDDLNLLYEQFYNELEKRLEIEGRANPNYFSDLWEFREYWKDNELTTYSSRRAYVSRLYRQDKNSAVGENKFWDTLQGDVREIAKPRYESGHFADAVEASLKELNTRIKIIVKQRIGEELDGSSLMNRAFSLNDPILVIDDLDTEDGRNIQKGYMQIYSGVMTGIRNPKAHSNIVLTADECEELLSLCSLLFKKFEASAAKIDSSEVEIAKQSLFLRVDKPENTGLLVNIREILTRYPGDMSVILVLDNKRSAMRLPMKIDKESNAISELEKLLGKRFVVISEDNAVKK